MKTERLQICTRVHAQPATRSGCGMAESLPSTRTFKKWEENNVVPIGLWPLEVGCVQNHSQGFEFPKGNYSEEGNGSPVQPAQLPQRKRVWVGSKSEPRARTLHGSLSPADQALLRSAARPVPTLTHPPLDRRGLDARQEQRLPSQSPTAYPQLQHQSHQGDATLQKPIGIFPFQWKPVKEESKQVMEGFSVSLDKHTKSSSKEAN